MALESNSPASKRPPSRFRAVRRLFGGGAPDESGTEPETCDLCRRALAPEHRHVLERATRRIFCVCDACAQRATAAAGGLALIPREVRILPTVCIPGARWTELSCPAGLAFLRRAGPEKVLALHPGPAGVVELPLVTAVWDDLRIANPGFALLKPEVEVLLVDGRGAVRAAYLAPLDAGYELLGLVRTHWSGRWGGAEARRMTDQFFGRLAAAAALALPVSCA